MTGEERDYLDGVGRLRREMERWVAQSVRLDPPGLQGGGEDEANYALAWFPHTLATGSPAAMAHFRRLREELSGWVARECHHGYEPRAEAHHGTEPFLLFLPRYLDLAPDDGAAAELLLDAAEHIGNWDAGIPAWYDWSGDHFRGYHLGSVEVPDAPRWRFECAEHVRFIHLALAAYRVGGEQRYLDWASRYGLVWAERILAAGDGPLPVLWTQTGRGLSAEDLTTDEQRTMSAAAHHAPGDPLAGLENLLASGVPQALGDLWRLTGEPRARQAAAALARRLVELITDPCADPAAAALLHHRRCCGDDGLDGIIRTMVSEFPSAADELVLCVRQRQVRDEAGVGRRRDMVRFGRRRDDGWIVPDTEPATAALALAWEVTGEVAYAARAVSGAAERLELARRVLRGGREHADMGGAVCSVAAGHGRNWGAGAVSGCYGPLVLGAVEECGRLSPMIEVRAGDRIGLPDSVAALVRQSDGAVKLFNGGDRALVTWRRAGGERWQETDLAPGQMHQGELRARPRR